MSMLSTQGWKHLPRDARDTLFLLAVIAWTVMPHASHLPGWCIALSVAVLVWRARLAWGNKPLPPRWVIIAVMLVAIAGTWLSYRSLLGKEPGVTLITVLMALKTLELRARRDAFVVFFLGFFLVLTHFLYSQSVGVAVAMLGSVWGLLTALVLAHMPVGKPSLRHAGGLAFRTAALGAPIMVLLFVFFPRLGPLWGVPQGLDGRTGLSNSLSFGSVAELATDDQIVMRLRFPNGAPPPQEMYFRGPVLSRFDGTNWTPLHGDFPLPARDDSLHVATRGYRYEVTIEPILRVPMLPLLDATPSIPRIEGLWTRRRDDLGWATNRLVRERLQFEATAYTRYRLGGAELSLDERRAHLAIPPDTAPRTVAWARALVAQPALARAEPAARVAAVMNHIREAGFSYTLAPGLYGEQNPKLAIDEFWLDRKEGFCEHFAATSTVVLRAMGIPARVVTGYQGTDPMPVDGYWVVRQAQAHAWIEYWSEDLGWVRADPTASVAPNRIFSNGALRPPAGLMAGALNTVDPRLMARLRNLWETLDHRWNQWILNYSRADQFSLLREIGFESPSWQDLVRVAVQALSGLCLLVAAWAWWDRRRQDPWTRRWNGLLSALERAGITATPSTSPRNLARLAHLRFGTQAKPMVDLLQELERLRYGPQAVSMPTNAWWRQAMTQARKLRQRTPQPEVRALGPSPESDAIIVR